MLIISLNFRADRKSHYEPSVVGQDEEHEIVVDEHDFVPHFQRVSISGEDTSGVSSVCSIKMNIFIYLFNFRYH